MRQERQALRLKRCKAAISIPTRLANADSAMAALCESFGHRNRDSLERPGIGFSTACYVRSHFDSVEVRVPDGPHPDEMLLVIAMTTGPRLHARVGGLAASDISKLDGQR